MLSHPRRVRDCATTTETATVVSHGKRSVAGLQHGCIEAPGVRECATTTVTATDVSHGERSVAGLQHGCTDAPGMRVCATTTAPAYSRSPRGTIRGSGTERLFDAPRMRGCAPAKASVPTTATHGVNPRGVLVGAELADAAHRNQKGACAASMETGNARRHPPFPISQEEGGGPLGREPNTPRPKTTYTFPQPEDDDLTRHGRNSIG